MRASLKFLVQSPSILDSHSLFVVLCLSRTDISTYKPIAGLDGEVSGWCCIRSGTPRATELSAADVGDSGVQATDLGVDREQAAQLSK